MKKLFIVLAILLTLNSCSNMFLPTTCDYSTVTSEVTCPMCGLYNEVFHSEHEIDNVGRFAGEITSDRFRYRRILYGDDYNDFIVVSFNIAIDTLIMNHKYILTPNNSYISISGSHCYINSEDLEFIEGYIIFNRHDVYLGRYCRLSGKFELKYNDATITNGTFIDIICFDSVGHTYEDQTNKNI